MITKWTQHLKDPEAITRWTNTVLAAKPVLEHLKILIESNETSLLTVERSNKVYDLPNWDYRQAHANGYLAALDDLKKLINLDQGNSNDRQLTRPKYTKHSDQSSS